MSDAKKLFIKFRQPIEKMDENLKNDIISTFSLVVNDLMELEASADLAYFAVQIAGSDSNLNSFKNHLGRIKQNDSDIKLISNQVFKKLSNFMLLYKKRNLSFFHPIPSNESLEDFYNQPINIINKILTYGIERGKVPIPDQNPIFETFGISYHFPECREEFRDCLLLLYRNILLQTLVIPLSEISNLPFANNYDKVNSNNAINTESLFRNIYVIESESGIKQGTAFYIPDIGIITCDHCIRNEDTDEIFTDLQIYNGDNFAQKYSVNVLKSNKFIDLAILNLPIELGERSGLKLGTSKNLLQQEKISVAGFPNYNFGDSGIFSPGVIVGFRKYVGMNHLLVNCPLISGNSGGPAFDSNNNVIGIAVTGADRMSKAFETEKHAIIPIEAIYTL